MVGLLDITLNSNLHSSKETGRQSCGKLNKDEAILVKSRIKKGTAKKENMFGTLQKPVSQQHWDQWCGLQFQLTMLWPCCQTKSK